MFGTSPVFTITIVIFYVLGFLCASLAILRSRTPQGASAWVVGLMTLPFFTVPLFLFFGRSKFYGYSTKHKRREKRIYEKMRHLENSVEEKDLAINDSDPLIQSLSKLCPPGFTTHNKIQLLIDGDQTYASMLKELEMAQNYIIFQFYIFRADSTGKTFGELLMRKARLGVRVYFMYDQIGTEVPDKFLQDLRSSGVEICPFNSFRGKGRFQINFRNHRKILIVDGRVAFVGGLNIGDDYLGLWPELGPWRDTHLRMEGPAVVACQMAHAKDWYWSKEEILPIDWKIPVTDGDANVLVLSTGPADEKQICLLAHLAMVNSAKERLWIANPYLVPPESLLDAILLAALRGVDVRFLVPSYSDAWIVMLASDVYIARLLQHGVRVYRYEDGFLHQKVMLVDDRFAVVGSANFDFRSMFINFEITVVGQEKAFLSDVDKMLRKDFVSSREVSLGEFKDLSLWKKISSRAANLLAPML